MQLTKADSEALRVASILGVGTGGWVPKGHQFGFDEYGLIAFDDDLESSIEQNIIESDGILLIYYKALSGTQAFALHVIEEHERHYIAFDLSERLPAEGASLVHLWIQNNRIQSLFIMAQDNDEIEIEKHTAVIVEGALLLEIMDAPQGEGLKEYDIPYIGRNTPVLPKTVDEAVEVLAKDMTLKDRVRIAKKNRQDLENLNLTLGKFVRDYFKLWGGNDDLITSCGEETGRGKVPVDEVSGVIIKRLWEKLRRSHRIRLMRN